MLVKDNENTYSIICDCCGKSIHYCPTSLLALEVIYDMQWKLNKGNSKLYCPICKEHQKEE